MIIEVKCIECGKQSAEGALCTNCNKPLITYVIYTYGRT